jgi:hypothetical protein
MSSRTGPLPQEEENLSTIYDIKMAALLGCYAFQGEFPSAAASSSRRGPPKPTPIVLSTPRNTCSSQQVEKAKFRDSPMDDSEVEIVKDSPAMPPTVTTPRPSQRRKTVIRPGPKVTAEAAEQLPGPQAIHPVGSPDLPLSLERLQRLKSVLETKTYILYIFMFFFLNFSYSFNS